jgi:E3 ubiquitin-protein ligase UBR4
MLAVDRIRTHWKQQVLGAVLHGYLGLRRLLIHRTKLIDDAEKKLLSLLEELTSGSFNASLPLPGTCISSYQLFSFQ